MPRGPTRRSKLPVPFIPVRAPLCAASPPGPNMPPHPHEARSSASQTSLFSFASPQALTDADQSPLYDENLLLDLAPWRRRAWPDALSQAEGPGHSGNASQPLSPWGGSGPARGRLSVAALVMWFARLPRRHSQRVLMIKGGRLVVLPLRSPGEAVRAVRLSNAARSAGAETGGTRQARCGPRDCHVHRVT